MAVDLEFLHGASYRGAFFYVTQTETKGGRDDVVKKLVNSDRQVVEDLGLRPRSYKVSGVIAARFNEDGSVRQSYVDVRDTLLLALEKGGVGLLVHPFYGEIPKLAARPYTLVEDMTGVGEARIAMQFDLDNATGAPIATAVGLAEVVKSTGAVDTAFQKDLVDNWAVSPGFTGNFGDATTKVQDYLDKIDAEVARLEATTSEIDAHAQLVSSIGATITNVVSLPQLMADSFSSLAASINGLFQVKDDVLRAFEGLFDYGDDDIAIGQTTSGLVERQRNRSLVNTAVQGMALAYAYQNASQVDFVTVSEIEAKSADLEEQFVKMRDSGETSSDVLDALGDLRVDALELFDEKKLTAKKVITIHTNLMPAAVLAYQLYGSTANTASIIDLNSLEDSFSVEGEVQVLTA